MQPLLAVVLKYFFITATSTAIQSSAVATSGGCALRCAKKMTNPKGHKPLPWQMCLLPIPFLAVGTWLTWVSATELYLERQSKDWPRASGVLHVEVGEYRKELSYQYRVDGVDYSSSRVVFGELGNKTRSREWEEVGRRPDGSAVEVFYMPDNPQESTLITQLCRRASSNLQTGLAFLVIGSFASILIPLVLKRISEQAARSNRQ